MHQLQKAPVQGVHCHPAGCHHHAPGHCTCSKPEKTPGECAPSKQQRKKKNNNGANQKRRRCRILEIENANHRRAKGILRTRAEGDPGITRLVAAGLRTSCPDRTEVSRSKVSEKPAETDALPDESNLEENYSERLLVDTKKIKAKKLSNQSSY